MKKLLVLLVYAILAMPLFAQSWSKDLEKAAKAGNVEAQVTVGNAYLRGDCVKQNTKKAVKWLFMAAQSGNSDAVKSMCTFYSKELEQIAAAGNANAQFALGNFYAEGNGVERNNEIAINWYGKAAVQGIKEAKPKILGVYNEAIEQLAVAGDADAQFALGNFYAEGNGIEQNKEIAFKWYGEAAAQGHKEAKPKVLGSYNTGIVKLAKAGDIDAASQVADFLFMGNGGATKNESEAAPYYAIAYKAGNKTAGKKLTTMYNAYLTGKGVPKNENLGYLYLAYASDAGIEEAIEKFYHTDNPYLRKSAQNGDKKAIYALSEITGDSRWYFPLLEKGDFQLWETLTNKVREKVKNKEPYYQRQEFDRYLYYPARDFALAYYGVDNFKIINPNVAHLLSLEWDQGDELFQRDIARKINKCLINEFNHKIAKESYDNWFFQYDYASQIYEIGSVGHVKLCGFKGIPNRLKFNSQIYISEVPTADELKMLLDSIPDFAINQEAIRVIRRAKTYEYNQKYYNNEEMLVLGHLDIFFLPGIIALGPKSYLEFNIDGVSKSKTLDKFVYDSNEVEINQREIIITPADSLNVYTLTNWGTSPHGLVEGVTNFQRVLEVDLQGHFSCIKDVKGYIEVIKKYYTATIDGQEVRLRERIGNDNNHIFELDSFKLKGEAQSECILSDKSYSFKYNKSDGSTKFVTVECLHLKNGYVINDSLDLHYSTIKKNLSAEFVEQVIQTCEACVVTENGADIKFRHGLPEDEYYAQLEQKQKQKQKEEQQLFVKELKEKLYKKYNKQMVDKYLNGRSVLMKGVNIHLISDYLEITWPREKWIEFYLTDSNGYGIYELHEGNVITGYFMTARIYTKNNIITSWVKY